MFFHKKNIKQVIVVRNDLKLGKGKLAAQVAHASLASYKVCLNMRKAIVDMWERQGMEKVVLKVDSEKELLELYEKVKDKLPCALITDAGKTQVPENTITCLGIGPWEEEIIDLYTGNLKLL
ncbi:MAG: peptidyl-tRNA hydrolase Pth2 [Candidatus Anstonellales archaeon]